MSKLRSPLLLRPAALPLVLLALLCAALPATVAAQSVPNLTGIARVLGNPVHQFYSRTADKESAQDLQIFQDRLYIGHGSTNSSQYTRILYYDLNARSFGYERDASGNPIWMRSELIRNMRVQDGELILEDYDPHGRVRFYRKNANGSWTINDVAGDAHARDMFKFGNEYFTNFGHTSATFPFMYRSADNGETWSAVKQTSLYSGFATVYEEFFEFKGKMYATGVGRGYDPDAKRMVTSNQPFMLRYDGNGRFGVAHARRQDFINTDGPEYVRHAEQLGRKLIFAWGKEVYLATSIEPARLTKVNLPADYINDIIVKGDRAYVLMWRSVGGGLYRNSVYRVEEDGSVRGILSLDLTSAIASAIELHEGTFFLSTSGLQLYAVQTSEVVHTPPPTPTPTPEPTPTPTAEMTLDLKVFLQGPFNASRKRMNAGLARYLEAARAFEGLPNALYGDALMWDIKPEALSLPVVDIVMIELRSSTAASSRVFRRGALLMDDGRVLGFDGESLPVVRDVPPGSYYVVIRHRNHLDVMSATKVDLSSGKGQYDFTTSASRAYGTQGQAQLASGVYGLYTGDMNSSGMVDTPDIFDMWSPQNGLWGYRGADVDLSGFVNVVDLLSLWLPNAGRKSNVPD